MNNIRFVLIIMTILGLLVPVCSSDTGGSHQDQISSVKEDEIIKRKKVNKLLKHAEKYLKSGRRDKAAAAYGEILAWDKDNLKAREFFSKDDSTLREIAVTHVNQLYSQALESYINGNYKEAIKYFDNSTVAALKYFEALVLTPPLRLDSIEFVEECRKKISEDELKIENLAKDEIKKRLLSMIERGGRFFARGYYKISYRELSDAKQLSEKNGINDFSEQITNLLNQSARAAADGQAEAGDKHFENKEYESASACYSDALKYDNENTDLKKKLYKVNDILAEKYYQSGLGLFTAGNTGEAKNLFEKALMYNPEKKEALRALERVK